MKIQNTDDYKCWKAHGATGTLFHCWWECKTAQTLQRTVLCFLRKLNILLPLDPAIMLLGIYSKEMKMMSSQNLHMDITAALLKPAKTWKQARYPSMGKYRNKLQHMNNGILFGASKKWANKTKKRHGGQLKKVKEANLKRLCTEWFQLHDNLE